MKLWKIISQILIIAFIVFSCNTKTQNKFNDSYYIISEEKWLSALSKIGYEKPKLNNKVLLISHSSACSPCLQEIDWWVKNGKNKTGADVALIVIERPKSVLD